MLDLRAGPPLAAPPAPGDPISLDHLGHLILETITARRAGVVTMIFIGVFTVVTRRQKDRWPTQAEIIKFALAMLGLPTATNIFAALVLLSPQIPGVSDDSLVALGIIGTVVVLIESCSTLLNLLKKRR